MTSSYVNIRVLYFILVTSCTQCTSEQTTPIVKLHQVKVENSIIKYRFKRLFLCKVLKPASKENKITISHNNKHYHLSYHDFNKMVKGLNWILI